MDYFGRSAREFERMQRDPIKERRGKLTPADKAGIGLQVGGAVVSDMSDQRMRDKELEQQEEQKKLAMIMGGRRDRTSAQQFERGAMQTDRSQNMAGFQMLADQRENAMQNARNYSFRNSFLKAMGA